MSLPASKGFEIGSGFAGTELTGLEHNDAFYMEGDRVRTRTNRSGGVQGGITNGEAVYFRVAFKPTATVMREQETVSAQGDDTTIAGRGPTRPVRAAARGADGRGDGRPRPRGSRACATKRSDPGRADRPQAGGDGPPARVVDPPPDPATWPRLSRRGPTTRERRRR